MSNTAENLPSLPHKIVVLSGTEPQAFQRLTSWTDSWLAARQNSAIEVIVQHGTARPLAAVDSTDWLLRDELSAELAASPIIVGSVDLELVRQARSLGRRIVAVPRLTSEDETERDQQRLGRGLANHGHLLLAESEAELHELLDRTLADPDLTLSLDAHRTEQAGTELEQLVSQLQSAAFTNDAADRPSTSSQNVAVLYVGGLGRSGSTLLNDMLGQHGNLVSGGEIVHLWQRGLVENNLCGCGEKFQSCEFWNEVGQRAFGGWDQLDLAAAMKAKNMVDRNRFVPHLLAPWLFRSIRGPLDEYGNIVVALLRAIRDVADVPVVVDSSKQISTALMYKRINGVDLKIAHLIRDARGVAYSWTKTKKKVEVTDTDALMNQYHPGLMGWRWLSWNVSFASMRALGIPVMTLQYEDVITNPRRALTRVMKFAGVDVGELEYVGDGTVNLQPTHSVAGNPSRFKHGDIELRLDEAWQNKLEPKMRRLVTLITYPLLRRYGYKAKGGRR